MTAKVHAICPALLAVALLPAAAAAAPANYCDIVTSVTIDGRTKVTTGRCWLRSRLSFRLQTGAANTGQIAIGDGKDVWRVLPVRKTAYHTRRSPEAMRRLQERARIIGDDVDNYVNAGAKKVKQEKVDGRVCNVYQLSRGGLTNTLWATADSERLTLRQDSGGKSEFSVAPGHPMKMHSIQRTVKYRWKSGAAMPASLFRPPAGYKVVEARPESVKPPVFSPPQPKLVPRR